MGTPGAVRRAESAYRRARPLGMLGAYRTAPRGVNLRAWACPGASGPLPGASPRPRDITTSTSNAEEGTPGSRPARLRAPRSPAVIPMGVARPWTALGPSVDRNATLARPSRAHLVISGPPQVHVGGPVGGSRQRREQGHRPAACIDIGGQRRGQAAPRKGCFLRVCRRTAIPPELRVAGPFAGYHMM